ncbi:adenylyl-sulfate kinase [Streptomyces sp. NPDC044780]|uniref:adenylyl-sulfate kinase n=1 Tax=unclassified Streptomyces TaxID=2593676 RepID=UPI0033E0B978
MVWITGLAESGKTTVSRRLINRLTRVGIKPVHLDGNAVREAVGTEGHAFDRTGRMSMAFTYARFSRMLSDQGHVVVCSTISLFHEVHSWNRRHIRNYLEVLLDVPMQELKRRDSKGVYARAKEGEVVGVDLDPEFPVAPDLRIVNFSGTTPDDAAERIYRACKHDSSTGSSHRHEKGRI